MAIDGSDHQLRRVLEAQQHFVGMETEIVFECGIDAGQHLDVCAGREKLIACAGQHDHVNVILHAGTQDCVIELPVHLVGVGVGGRIAHLDNCHTAFGAVIHKLLCSFASCRLHRGGHIYDSFVMQS
jgi:hypothetical protein